MPWQLSSIVMCKIGFLSVTPLLQMVALVAILSFYAIHCVWVSAEMYSAPSIVLQSRRPDGSVHVFDDFREAYAWLRHNTDDNAKVKVKARSKTHKLRYLWSL